MGNQTFEFPLWPQVEYSPRTGSEIRGLRPVTSMQNPTEREGTEETSDSLTCSWQQCVENAEKNGKRWM